MEEAFNVRTSFLLHFEKYTSILQNDTFNFIMNDRICMSLVYYDFFKY